MHKSVCNNTVSDSTSDLNCCPVLVACRVVLANRIYGAVCGDVNAGPHVPKAKKAQSQAVKNKASPKFAAMERRLLHADGELAATKNLSKVYMRFVCPLPYLLFILVVRFAVIGAIDLQVVSSHSLCRLHGRCLSL